MTAQSDTMQSFGGFMLAGMQLALPMAALREVLPCVALQSLPNPAAAVVGGVAFRQLLLPVLDLRVVLGKPTTAIEFPCVIVMLYEGRLLGLLAESVSGIFSAELDSLHQVAVADRTAAIFQASVMRSDDQRFVSVLAPAQISNLEQVPMIADPEPTREHATADEAELSVTVNASKPVMLMRCGRLHFAIDAIVVHSTVADPVVIRSALSFGHCLGVIEHAGQRIPLLDFQYFCGFGNLVGDGVKQAFIISLASGKVAFLIEQVVDVVRLLSDQLIALPAFSLALPQLFAGALPWSALAPELRGDEARDGSPYLFIDTANFLAAPEILSLAAANTSVPQQERRMAVAGRIGGSGVTRSMLVYDAGGECVTPLEQVAMILPYSSDLEQFAKDSILRGFLENRGRSITVLDLNRLQQLDSFALTAVSCVLVVEVEQGLIGFLVRELKTIAEANWEPQVSDLGGSGGSANLRKLAYLNLGDERKMLPLRDLQQLARQVSAGGYAELSSASRSALH